MASEMTTVGKPVVIVPPAGWKTGMDVAVFGAGSGEVVCCCGVVPPPAPPQPMPEARISARKKLSVTETVEVHRAPWISVLRPACRADQSARASAAERAMRRGSAGAEGDEGPGARGGAGGAAEPEAVVIEIVNGAGLPLEIATLAGVLHVATKGTPVQEKVSVPVKPVPADAIRLNCAAWPAETAAVVNVPGAGEILTEAAPLPLMGSDCGELGALSVRIKFVERTPAACGVKTMEMTQVWLAPSEELQVFELMAKSPALEPLNATAENCSEALPEFVTVMDCVRLAEPCAIVPGKVSEVEGLKVTAGAGGGEATAVPESAICCGLPGALSVMKSDAWLLPTDDGA